VKEGCDKYDYIKYPLTKQHQRSEIFFSYYAVDFIKLFTAESAFRISNVTYYRVATHLSTCDGEEYKIVCYSYFHEGVEVTIRTVISEMNEGQKSTLRYMRGYHKSKAIPVTGPESSRKLRLPDFKAIDT